MNEQAGRHDWGNVSFRITRPTSGGWCTFDLVVKQCGHEQRISDIEDDFRWTSRLWNRLARPFRKAK